MDTSAAIPLEESTLSLLEELEKLQSENNTLNENLLHNKTDDSCTISESERNQSPDER